MSTNHITYFYLLNGEAEKDLSAETPIAMLTFLLPLKGQNNILKVFEEYDCIGTEFSHII